MGNRAALFGLSQTSGNCDGRRFYEAERRVYKALHEIARIENISGTLRRAGHRAAQICGQTNLSAFSRSFAKGVSDLPSLEEAVSNFASSCAAKLRRQKSVATCITAFIMTNFYNERSDKYYNSVTVTMQQPFQQYGGDCPGCTQGSFADFQGGLFIQEGPVSLQPKFRLTGMYSKIFFMKRTMSGWRA